MRGFYRFLREERQYCAVLAHLLMSSQENLEAFLDLINRRLGDEANFAYDDDAEIYLEYSYLRDKWDELRKPLREDPRKNRLADYESVNLAKRGLLLDLLLGIPELANIEPPDAAEGTAAWNAYFMGPAGNRIVREVASPALWPVSGLATQFGSDPAAFYSLCKLKWSFRIKPDLVLIMPRQRPICIEAKMESPEGTYPNGEECRVVDTVMGKTTRCRQFELQEFMFRDLLGVPCQSLVIAQRPTASLSTPALSWGEVLTSLDASHSLPFVRRFLDSNENLIRSYAYHRVHQGG